MSAHEPCAASPVFRSMRATRSFTNYGLAYSPDGRVLAHERGDLRRGGRPLPFRDSCFVTVRPVGRLGRVIDAGTLGTEEPFVGHGPRLAGSPSRPTAARSSPGRHSSRRRVGCEDRPPSAVVRAGAELRRLAGWQRPSQHRQGRERRAGQASTPGRRRGFSGHHGGAVNGAAFTPDGNSLLTAGTDGDVLVWDVASGSIRETLSGHVANVQDTRRRAGRQDGGSPSPTTRRP